MRSVRELSNSFQMRRAPNRMYAGEQRVKDTRNDPEKMLRKQSQCKRDRFISLDEVERDEAYGFGTGGGSNSREALLAKTSCCTSR